MKNKRLAGALIYTEKKRLGRVEEKKSKRAGDKSIYERKLTQQKAAAYCGMSVGTLKKRQESGLKTVWYGKWKRFLIEDLHAFMRKRGFKK